MRRSQGELRRSEIAVSPQLSERDRTILDLNAFVSDLKSKVESLETSAADEAKVSSAKMTKMSSEVEELRERKREVESALKSLQSDYDQMGHANEDLSVKIVEKERQGKGETTQVQSMQMSYEKHKREMSEKLEKTVKSETEAVGGLQVSDYVKFTQGVRVRGIHDLNIIN